jgi:hypothetical protein
MTTVSMRNDMTALREFLKSAKYTKVNPKEELLISAINYMHKNKNVETALLILKEALNEEDGWFMKILQKHKNDEAYVSAYNVCVRIYTSIKFMSGDSHAPNQPTHGEWHYVDFNDEVDMSRAMEIQAYCDLKVSCTNYINFLISQFDEELQNKYPGTEEAIMDMFATYPTGDNLLKFSTKYPQTTERTVRYHTSYFTDSTTDHYTRSWLLANVRVAMQQLQEYKNTLFEQFMEVSRERHTRLYESLLLEYQTWEPLAIAGFNIQFPQIQKRECSGNKNLDALLEELRCALT